MSLEIDVVMLFSPLDRACIIRERNVVTLFSPVNRACIIRERNVVTLFSPVNRACIIRERNVVTLFSPVNRACIIRERKREIECLLERILEKLVNNNSGFLDVLCRHKFQLDITKVV